MGGTAASVGNLAGLAGGFQKLGISPDQISGFVKTVTDFIRSKGGDSIADALEGLVGK